MPLFDDYTPGSFAGGASPDANSGAPGMYLPPIGQPIGVAPQTATVTPTTGSNPAPSGAVGFGNLSSFLGGGQYAKAPSSNQIIKTPRGLTTTQEKSVLRGPYTSKDVIVDHIMPLELGGTNDLKNVMLQPIIGSYRKDLIENLSTELFKAGKISLPLARTMMLNWNNDPSAVLPNYKELLNDPTLNKMIYVHDDTGKQSQINMRDGLAKLSGSDFAHDISGDPTHLTWGGFWNDLKQNTTKYLGDIAYQVVQKPLQGINALLGGTATGLITGSPKRGVQYAKEAFSDQPNAQGVQAAFTDPAFETVTKRFMKGFSAGLLNPEIKTAPDLLQQDLQKFVGAFAQGAGMYASFEGLGALGSYAAGTEALAPASEWLSSTSVAKALNASPLASSLLKNVALMGTYNQIEMPFNSSLNARAHSFLDSAINAGLYTLGGNFINAKYPAAVAGERSLTNMTVATALNGFAGYVISQMQGASKQDSLTNAGLFMALHGMGYYSNSFELNTQIAAQKEAVDIFKQLGVERPPASAKEATVAFDQIQTSLKQDVMNGTMTVDEATARFQQALPAYHALYNSYLPLREQVTNNLRDMASAYVTARGENRVQTQIQQKINGSVKADEETADFAKQDQTLQQQSQPTTPEVAGLNNLTTKLPTPVEQPNAITEPLHDRFMTTGMAEQTNSIANKNQINVINALEQKANVQVILEREPGNPKDPQAVAVKAIIDGGKPLPLGYIPRRENIVTNQNAPKFEGQIPFNPETNNELFAGRMDQLGINRLAANIELQRASVGQLSGQPYMILRAGPEAWDRAQQISSTPPAESPPLIKYNNREDYYSQMPASEAKTVVDQTFSKLEGLVAKGDYKNVSKMLNSFGEIITPEMEGVLKNNVDDLTYRQLITPLNEANKNGKLNEQGKKFLDLLNQNLRDFQDVHGRDGALNFLQLPLHKNEAVPTPVENTALQLAVEPSISETEAPMVAPEPDLEIPPVVKEQAQKVALDMPTDFNIFYNQIIQAGPRAVMDGDYNTFNDAGKLGGISKRVVNKILELTSEGIDKSDPRIGALYKFYDSLGHDQLQQAAKRSTGFDDFLSRYVTKAQSLDIPPFDQIEGQPISKDNMYDTYNNNQLQELRRRYLTLAQTPKAGKELSMNATKGGLKISIQDSKPQEPMSWLHNKIGTSEDASKGLELVGFSGPEDRGAKWPVGNKAPDRLQFIVEQMRKNDVFAISDQNGDVNNAQGVLIPPKLQKEYLKRYYNDPARYELNNPEILDNMQKILGKTDLTEDGKIMQVFYRDVMGLPDATADVVNKRINLLDHSAIQWNVPGKMQILFFPATELKGMVDQVFPAGAASDPTVQEMVQNKFLEDGARFMFPEDMNAINYYMGIPKETNNTKGTVVADLPSGVFAEKGNTAALNAPLRQYLEKTYGITLKPGQIVSFTPNIKMGEEGLSTLPENKDIKALTINKSDMRYIFEKPHDVDNQEGTFAFSNLGNFSANDSAEYNGQQVPIKDYLTHLFAPSADQWLAAANEVYKDGGNPNEVFGKYFGNTLEDVGYGKLTTIASRGGDILSLRRQFDTNMAKQFRETVMRNRNMDSAYLKLTPDMGFIDPKTGEKRILAPDEIMISKELATKWGNPESVLTLRYPITGKLAMSKLNVLVGEDYGIDTLGSSNVIDNHFDTIIRKQADHDGDGLTVIKIIPKEQADQLMADGKPFDGMPEPIADHIEQERARYTGQYGREPNPEMIKVGDRQISIAGAKYPKLPAADQDGLLYVMKRATMAKQEIGGISNNKNMARMFVDNIGSPAAQQIFTVNGQYYPPQINADIENSIGAMVQAAVDATSKDVFGNLTEVEKNPLAAIFNTTDPKVLRGLSKNIQSTYLAGLRLNKTTYDSLGDTATSKGQITPGMVAEIKKFLTTSPQDAVMQHPMQAIFSKFAGFDVPKVSMKDMWESDKYAGKKLVDNQAVPTVTADAQKFIDFFVQQQQLKSQTAQQVRKMPEGTIKDDKLAALDSYKDPNNIRNYYYSHLGDYSKEDKAAISWFLTTDKKANWYWDPEFDKPLKNYPEGYNNKMGGLVERFDDLMLPEHGTSYYQARNAWIQEEMLGITPQVAEQLAANPPEPAIVDPSQALKDMTLWQKFATSKNLKTFDNTPDTFLLQQNEQKPTRWSNLAKAGNQVAWEMNKKSGGYTGRVWINGEYYTPSEAAKKFLYGKKS